MKELDKKMAIKNSKYQEEMNQVQDSHELEVAGLLSEHQAQGEGGAAGDDELWEQQGPQGPQRRNGGADRV